MRFEFDRDCDYDLIDSLDVNELSRDDIVRTLLALKYLYKAKYVLAIILALIGCAYRRIAATDDGRPKMDYWSILVLTVL